MRACGTSHRQTCANKLTRPTDWGANAVAEAMQRAVTAAESFMVSFVARSRAVSDGVDQSSRNLKKHHVSISIIGRCRGKRELRPFPAEGIIAKPGSYHFASKLRLFSRLKIPCSLMFERTLIRSRAYACVRASSSGKHVQLYRYRLLTS
jgi:hypothetical protein